MQLLRNVSSASTSAALTRAHLLLNVHTETGH